MKKIVIATRGSKLALCQAEMVKKKIENLGWSAELLIVKTSGDKDRVSPLRNIGGNGLFIREIEKSLLDGKADIAVHSGKDLPYELGQGLIIGATPCMDDVRDCIVTKKGAILPTNPTIGTGSERRISQLSSIYPTATFKEIRGNIDTRIQKLLAGEYDAICLAMAGVTRLGIIDEKEEVDIIPIDINTCIPAACQGILAVECRDTDEDVLEVLKQIDDEEARFRFETERKLFIKLQADCSMAVAVNVCIVPVENSEKVEIKALYKNKKEVVACRIEDVDKNIDQIVQKLKE